MSANEGVCHKKDEVIYLSVTSDSTIGYGWPKRLKRKGFAVGDWGKHVLSSPEFSSTSGVTTEIAILKGTLFEGTDTDRTAKRIRAYAESFTFSDRKLASPNHEAACLLCEKFRAVDFKEAGLSQVVVMSKFVVDAEGGRPPEELLGFGYNADDGEEWFDAITGDLDHWFRRDVGFAFAIA